MANRITWEERLTLAEKTGFATKEDIDLASSFTSCAVAERFNNPPRHVHSWDVQRLGLDFYFALTGAGPRSRASEEKRQNALKAARHIFNLIQRVRPGIPAGIGAMLRTDYLTARRAQNGGFPAYAEQHYADLDLEEVA